MPSKSRKRTKRPAKKRSTSSSQKINRSYVNSNVKYLFYFFTFAIVVSFFLLGWLYFNGSISKINFEANSTIALSLLFPFSVFSYLMFKKKLSLQEVFSSLYFNLKRLTLKSIIIGIVLFVAIFVLEALFSVFQTVTHIPLPTNVQALLKGMPLYFIIFSVVVAPIDEEILFRGFLVPRIGIILSALVFAFLHISYISISEFVAAFIFGLLAGYVFKKTKSLYTTIIGHALVNLLTIIVLFL